MSSEFAKRSVALVVERASSVGPRETPGAASCERALEPLLLLVQRPPDDEDLPDTWGLPAGSLRAGEAWEDAVRRTGWEKLGVEVRVGPFLDEGETQRKGYVLRMRLYGAEIQAGTPSVPQSAPDVTQYVAWEWGKPERLVAGARQGSLCSRLCLDWLAGSD